MIIWVRLHRGELVRWPEPTHNDLALNLEVEDNDFLLGFNLTQNEIPEVGAEYVKDAVFGRPRTCPNGTAPASMATMPEICDCGNIRGTTTTTRETENKRRNEMLTKGLFLWVLTASTFRSNVSTLQPTEGRRRQRNDQDLSRKQESVVQLAGLP